MSEAEFRKLKEKHDAAAREADEARGALSAMKAQLKKDFGLDGLKEARAALGELKKKRARLESEFERELAAYQKAWPE